jgi:hypothetical protein
LVFSKKYIDLPALRDLIAGMKKKPSVQYTVRDVPEEIDGLLRETATLEGVSLNQATLHALQRGLGTERTPVRYRTLRQMLAQTSKASTEAWRAALEEQDKTNPEDWK